MREVPVFTFGNTPDAVIRLGGDREFPVKKIQRRPIRVREQVKQAFDGIREAGADELVLRAKVVELLRLLVCDEAADLVKDDEETYPTLDLIAIVRRVQDPEADEDPFPKAAPRLPVEVVERSTGAESSPS